MPSEARGRELAAFEARINEHVVAIDELARYIVEVNASLANVFL